MTHLLKKSKSGIPFNLFSPNTPDSFKQKYPHLEEFKSVEQKSGRAFVYYYKDETEQRYYVLKVDKNNNNKNYLLEEAKITLSCCGPSTVSLIDYNYKCCRDQYLLLDYIPSLPLSYFSHILKEEGPKCYKILYGVARAMDSITKKVLHRDITPPNILIDHNYQPYIIDFGESEFLKGNENKITSIFMRSSNSEEMIHYTKSENRQKGTRATADRKITDGNKRTYSQATEVHAFGMSFIYSYANIWNLSDKEYEEKKDKVRDNLEHLESPTFLTQLLIKCTGEESERPTFAQICKSIDKYISEEKDPNEFREYYYYREYLELKYPQFEEEKKNRIPYFNGLSDDDYEKILKIPPLNIKGTQENFDKFELFEKEILEQNKQNKQTET